MIVIVLVLVVGMLFGAVLADRVFQSGATSASRRALERLESTLGGLETAYSMKAAWLAAQRELSGRNVAGRDMGARDPDGAADRDLADRDLADRDLADRDLADRDLADRDLAGWDLAGWDLAGWDLADRDPAGAADRDLAGWDPAGWDGGGRSGLTGHGGDLDERVLHLPQRRR
jgi:hypothetical protein